MILMKYFIVSKSPERYSNFCWYNRIDPRSSFYCRSIQRALDDIDLNRRKGVPSTMIILDCDEDKEGFTSQDDMKITLSLSPYLYLDNWGDN